jgi:hypothetical protein
MDSSVSPTHGEQEMSVWNGHYACLLNSYQKYYNEARTHLSLHKDAPIPRAVQTVGRTLAMPVLGGLHHQYFRA